MYIPGNTSHDQRYATKMKMVVDMELQKAKDVVFQLMKEKDKIESDLRALKEVLDSVCIAFDFMTTRETLPPRAIPSSSCSMICQILESFVSHSWHNCRIISAWTSR